MDAREKLLDLLNGGSQLKQTGSSHRNGELVSVHCHDRLDRAPILDVSVSGYQGTKTISVAVYEEVGVLDVESLQRSPTYGFRIELVKGSGGGFTACGIASAADAEKRAMGRALAYFNGGFPRS